MNGTFKGEPKTRGIGGGVNYTHNYRRKYLQDIRVIILCNGMHDIYRMKGFVENWSHI